MTQLATSPRALLTAVPEHGDRLYEIVNGQRVEQTPMGVLEAWIATILDRSLWPHVEAHKLGRLVREVLFTLDTGRDLRRRPDLALVSYQRWPRIRLVPDAASWDVVPELVVEVVSPTDLMKDVVAKVREYFQAGVQLVWVVLPTEKQVYVYESATRIQVLTPADELDGGKVLPGLRLPVGPLFEEETDTEA